MPSAGRSRFDDLLVFGPDPERQAEALRAATIEAMLKAGIAPEKIHAFRRTGLLAGENNWHLLTDEQRADWVAALAEYRERTRTTH
jgi:hypothetical protein